MSLWESAESALRPRREPTELEAQAITEVTEMALEFAALPTDRRLSFLTAVIGHTSPRQRFLATVFTETTDGAWAPLMLLLDALIATQQGVATTHGWFDEATIRNAGGRLIPDSGGEMVQFPDAGGVYRAPGQRKPKISQFSAGHVVERRSREWWEPADEGAA